MSSFLETTCIKNLKIFHTYSFTKKSFVHDMLSHKFPILFMNEVIYYE